MYTFGIMNNQDEGLSCESSFKSKANGDSSKNSRFQFMIKGEDGWTNLFLLLLTDAICKCKKFMLTRGSFFELLQSLLLLLLLLVLLLHWFKKFRSLVWCSEFRPLDWLGGFLGLCGAVLPIPLN